MMTSRTVAEAIADQARLAPDRGFTFQDLQGRETRRTFRELDSDAARVAAALQRMGLQKGDRFGLVVIEPHEFVVTFLGAVRMGAVPVPLYPPLSLNALEAWVDRTVRVLVRSGARAVLASEKVLPLFWKVETRAPAVTIVAPVDGLARAEGTPDLPEILPSDLAFLQYTSGSTAEPRGVMVTHASLRANCVGIIEEGMKVQPDETSVTWLPLYHDMGLIGFVIAPIFYGLEIVFIPTPRFLARPSVWMETIHRYRAAATFGPNFAYALATRRARTEDLSRWDLSCLRVCGCGAEPIQAETMRAFTKLFHEQCGLPVTAVLPAFGMAEATLAVTMKPLGQEMRTRILDAGAFQARGEVTPAVYLQPSLEHVSCGRPFKGHEIAIEAETGERLPEGREGEVLLRGPSVTAGYFDDEEGTAATFRDGWLHTGDLGYLLDGELYLTGRIKDLIILNGRNVHPQAVEWAASRVDGIRQGNVVAFSRPGRYSEEVVVVFEASRDDLDLDDVYARVRTAVQQDLEIKVSEVRALPRGTLPKTSSGKLQRRNTRAAWLDGTLGTGAVRMSVASLVEKAGL